MTEIRLKRAYDGAANSDGPRLLVDRVWPRGVSKEDANISHWLKELAPSTDLRKWFDHDPDKWSEFQKRYLKEPKNNESDDVKQLKQCLSEHKRITLVFAAKDTEHNNAVALQAFIKKGDI